MKYIIKKTLFFLITLWAALTINFMLPRMMPGDPVSVMVAKFQGKLNPEAIHSLQKAFGLDTNLSPINQYFDYLKRMFTGDFGISISYFPSNVSDILSRAFPWTIGLAGISLIIAFTLGTILGIKSSWKRNSALSSSSVIFSLFFNAMPYFWFALLINYIFGFALGWFPLSGAYDGDSIGFSKFISILYHAFLPALTIIITAMGGWLLTMRNNMITVLAEDFVSFAYAKGLSEEQIVYSYAARNAILPSFTGFAMSLGFVVSGTLLTEIVFSYPGIGYLLYQSVLNMDYPLMQAIFLFITLSVLIANFIADILYVFLDPRARTGGE
ncbi:ABC transporter permease [Oceanotoga sp. DSM 15011]|jgi:peptide/nickel transport system permease protein|uniref:ABC transporter permease n=1 Tax=unclassified Oceanotoga TaxID=2618448 RepID=UPI0021F4BADC|nr:MULTISPECIES: ABC transporter permease [unclassified Oceanotoga]MDN5343260.1 peptide/nickel transport system permease protein [Oceanotoga sp.]UYO98927.1 ABC transporter permease [Oceanotoga sp. DSM 15011]UYO99007.1 ABC transporter permease [Oceanotoga sp. DSM 15011]